ncbi:MAG: hypothetical protein HY954_08435 [Deltaproteobacteria bacterium]|nr:hypothetical protein [Deltaproteobacteria bacterium]
MEAKLNCWEAKQCGREPGGAKVSELGVCPACTDGASNKLNGGKNGGRLCWAITGSFCGGKVQGTFAQKKLTCMSCDFYKLVKTAEGKDFALLKPDQKYTGRI